jgi:hypothetical protein
MDPSFVSYLVTTGKASLEATHADGEDFLPTLVVEDGDGRFNIVALVGGHPYEMVRASVPMLRDMQPRCIGFTADSFMAKGDDDDLLLLRRESYGGSLQRMFEAGEPGVSECLTINIVTATETQTLQLPYTRVADGIVWDEAPALDDAVFSGRMIDALRSVWS